MTPLSVEAIGFQITYHGFYIDFAIQRNAQQQHRGLCPQKLSLATTVASTLGIVQEMCSIGIRWCFSMGQHTEDHKWIWRTYILQLLLLYLVLQNFSEEEYLGATTADPKNWCMLTSGVMGMGWGREAILLGSKIITHNHLSIQKEKVWTGMDSQMESLYLVLDMDLAMMLQRN